MKWIGLTGGIATGKTTVQKILTEQKFPVIDADSIAHELTQKNADGYKQIVSQFGTDVLLPDLAIDRKKLGALVFNNPTELVKLENLLHPLIQAEVQRRRAHYESQGHKFCFYDVPLLFEKKLQKNFDLIVLVFSPLSLQIERAMKRNNLTHTEALVRINSQISIYEKLPLANYCIDNSTNLHDLKLQISHLLNQLSQIPT